MSSRFYFNSEDPRTELDPDGIELANIEEGQKEALGLLGRLLQDADRSFPLAREGVESMGDRWPKWHRKMYFLNYKYRLTSPTRLDPSRFQIRSKKNTRG